MNNEKQKTPEIQIKQRKIGPGHSVYVIAEMSANHNQSFDEAVKIIHAAKEAGVDAVKIQTYTADTMTLPLKKKFFQIGGGTLWDGETLHALYERAHTPWEWHPKLKTIAEELGLDFFSTPFDDTAVDFLEEQDVPVYKVASFEIVDLPLIQKIARTGKPMIISTGMASLAEIEEAVHTARKEGNTQIALLKCTSAYPARPQDMNLRTIPHLAATFGVPAGLSDHSLAMEVPVTAVGLGACLVEKHLTFSRKVPSADSGFSLEPQEFKNMVTAIRVAEEALGTVSYSLSELEQKSRVFRRSIFVVKNMKAGESFTEQNLRIIRPGQGLAPKYLTDVLRRQASCDIEAGTPLEWNHISGKPLAAAMKEGLRD